MAIIYSYPTVTPTSDDLVLGSDVNADGKPTKNFTIQSIVDIVQGGATGLGAVLTISGDALQQPATNFTNVQGTGTSTFNSFTTGTMTITGGLGTGFINITSTSFTGNITGIVKTGSSIEGPVTGVTQPPGTNNTTLATTEFVQAKVDPSVLTFNGTSGGDQTVNLVSEKFSLLGTANEIESVSTAQTITFGFPTAGVVLPDGSTATTQATSDDSDKVATTKFVHDFSDAQDLDFTDGSSNGSVILGGPNAQTFSILGTTNEITTNAANQTLTIGLPNSVTISGTYTGATFDGDLNGTINTATTGITQTAGNNSTKIATTAYVDSAAGAKTLTYKDATSALNTLNLSTDKLQFESGGTNINVIASAVSNSVGKIDIDLSNNVTITGTMTAGTLSDGTFSGTAGTYTGGVSITSTDFVGALTGNASTATALASSGAISLSGDTTSTGGPHTYTSGGAVTIPTTIADTTVTGKVLTNLPTPTSGSIAASDTILAAMAKLQGQITSTTGLAYEGTWDARNSAEGGSSDGGNPDLTQAGKKVNGHFYIVSNAGNAEPNGGAGTQLSPWAVGDWCIYVSNGSSTDEWQKLDQSNEVLGSGAANKIAKWTSANTLGTGLISDNGSTVSIGDTGAFEVLGNTTLGNADTDTTLVKGPAHFEETLRADVGIGLGGATYGTAGQVLTSGGGAASVNTWTTPTTGTVTSVGLTETGNALTITGSPVTSSGTINIAGAGASTDYINGELNLVAFPTLDNYQYWTLSDGSNTTNITTTGTAVFTGGTYITTSESNGTLTVTHDATTRADTTSTDAPAFGATFDAVTSVTSNATGHVTAIDVSTVTLPSLPTLDNYQSWTLAGDTGIDQTISSLNTANILGGTGIATVGSNADTLTINFDGTFPAAHGTQYSLPLWTTATTLGDSQISQNSLATEITATSSFKVTGKHLSVGGGTTKGLTVGGGGPTKAGFNFGTSLPTTNQDFVAQQGIHYSGRLSANSTKKVMATVADSVAAADFFGITARVYITSGFPGNANDTSVRTARIYDVACIPGQTPVFNKVIDQTTVGTLTVEFDAYTDGAATPKRGFTVNFTTNSFSNSQFYTTIEMLSARRASVIFAAS